MKRLLALCLLPAFGLFLSAAEEPKTSRLSPQEISDGWISLFDGESTFGWSAPNGSQWTIANGMLAPQAGKPGLLVTNTRFQDYQLKVEYRVRTDNQVKLLLGCKADGTSEHPAPEPKETKEKGERPDFERQVMLRNYGDNWVEMDVRFESGKIRSAQGKVRGGFGRFALPTVGTKGGPVTPEESKPGHLAISGNGVIIRTVAVRPLGTTSIFNGKDLTGWKEFPGKKAKFSVTKEGEISAKDGPGDLQSEGQWDNFVLQVECKTNGPKLNSGIFFRCIPGQYQNGYEDQIHNGWLAEGTKDYKVEEYDPQTHELKDTKTVKSAAQDYGTGAIYRRVPARKQAANDNEWFTMTIVADGRHIATWVNGVQTVDWTDNRPLKDNPRNGCRLEKGPISLQAHDLTTDLLFRSFRITELAPRKEKQPDEKK
jgi:hypothetical protein